MSWSRFFKSSGFKLGLIVASLVMVLMVMLNFAVLRSSQEVFIKTIESIRVMDYVRRTGELPDNFDILRFDFSGKRRLHPLQDEFRNELQSSLLRIGLFAVAGSFAIGYFSAKSYTTTLNKLRRGMKSLRDEDYKQHLLATGDLEFDEVIEEFNNLTEKLQTAEELRKDLISDTSHELRTPITALMGQLEGIRDGVISFDKARNELLLDQVYRLDILIETLQEYSRLRAKTLKIKLTNVKIKQLVELVFESYKPKLKQVGIQIHIDIAEDISVRMDRFRIEQVLHNLFNNAIEYSQATAIFIEADESKLIFRDNGIGVADTELTRLFERFYRVDKSRNRSSGGMGLGLAIVKEIIEAHGWKIKVENANGLKFILQYA